MLYMVHPDKEANWDAYTELPGGGKRSWQSFSTEERQAFPRFEYARETVIDLAPGDALWIPCGWPHSI
eukprot:5373000-Prymnesium_polylepis.1